MIQLQAREERAWRFGSSSRSMRHPAKGDELAQAMKARCEVSRQDADCEQFEVFQSVSDPDKLVLLELWKDQAALDAHAKLQAQRPPLPEGLRLGAGEREDYTYNRTR